MAVQIATVALSAIPGIPLPAGIPASGAIGPFASSTFLLESAFTAPLQFFNLGIIQVDAATRGVAPFAGAAPSGAFAFPFGFPFLPFPFLPASGAAAAFPFGISTSGLPQFPFLGVI